VVTVPTQQPARFGALLRQHRVAAGLTQEALAERAGLATRGISDLERGLRTSPHQDTVNRLIEALTLSAEEAATLRAAARGPARTPPEAQAAATPLPTETQGAPPPATLSDQPRPVGFAPLHALTARMTPGMGTRLAIIVLLSAMLGSNIIAAGAQRLGPRGGTLCLATEFYAGNDVGQGLSLEHAADLAVQQNKSLGNGYTLMALHYQGVSPATARQDPQQAARTVSAMVQTPCILGMVGPISSSVAAVEMPVTAAAGLVMISPANTNPGLTMRLYAAANGVNFDQLHPAGKKINYFRTVVNDALQGREIADLASLQPPNGLGAKSAFVVEDHSSYGEVVAGGFTQEFLAQGGSIAGTEGMPFGGAARIAELAARIVAARPDVVCYGGQTDGGGGTLEAQLVHAGYRGLFVSGDGIAMDPSFIDQVGGADASNVFAINPIPDPATFTTGKAARFVHDFHASYPGQYLDGYGAYAYDATMILITAIKHLIQKGQAVTRPAVLDQVQNIQYVGATGQINFDPNGDNAHGIFSLYTVQQGKWVWVKQESA
jgi:branched-chain amino acid transport system substrate-binding protein